MPKPIFKNALIAISGDLGTNREPAKLKTWIEDKGGRWAGTKVEAGVTHLVCSSANYRKGTVPAVVAAERLKIPVVTYDWLEDCLMDKKGYKAVSFFHFLYGCG